MIILFTDFGLTGPYTGQLKAALLSAAPNTPQVELFSDLPPFDVAAAAHLLDAYRHEFPVQTVFVCVVDPGVGSMMRKPVIVRADEQWFVGPANGLFDLLALRSRQFEAWEILWRPKRLSASFHGRDLFAPVAAELAQGRFPEARPYNYECRDPSLVNGCRIIYIDRYGNLITGLRATDVPLTASLSYQGEQLLRQRTFSDVAEGTPLCYENSSGLLEIAVNLGSAERHYDAHVGDEVVLLDNN